MPRKATKPKVTRKPRADTANFMDGMHELTKKAKSGKINFPEAIKLIGLLQAENVELQNKEHHWHEEYAKMRDDIRSWVPGSTHSKLTDAHQRLTIAFANECEKHLGKVARIKALEKSLSLLSDQCLELNDERHRSDRLVEAMQALADKQDGIVSLDTAKRVVKYANDMREDALGAYGEDETTIGTLADAASDGLT